MNASWFKDVKDGFQEALEFEDVRNVLTGNPDVEDVAKKPLRWRFQRLQAWWKRCRIESCRWWG